jgi:pyruvate ferredoxin oxidoreductase gamma subunit
MQELRIHGRGGQGGKLLAKMIARMLFLCGYQTQDFAMYGAERRGAPVISFVRWDERPIRERGYIFEPDYVIILDDSLDFKIMLKGLKANGTVLINSKKGEEFFRKSIQQRLFVLDATGIALNFMKRPFVNSVLFGAFAKILGIEFAKVEEAIKIELEEEGKSELIEKNVILAKHGFEAIP